MRDVCRFSNENRTRIRAEHVCYNTDNYLFFLLSHPAMAWNESEDMYAHTHFFNWKRDCVLQPELSLKEVARRLGEMWRVRCALESFCIQVLFLSLRWLTNWFSFISPVTYPCSHFTTHSSHPLTQSLNSLFCVCRIWTVKGKSSTVDRLKSPEKFIPVRPWNLLCMSSGAAARLFAMIF